MLNNKVVQKSTLLYDLIVFHFAVTVINSIFVEGQYFLRSSIFSKISWKIFDFNHNSNSKIPIFWTKKFVYFRLQRSVEPLWVQNIRKLDYPKKEKKDVYNFI